VNAIQRPAIPGSQADATPATATTKKSVRFYCIVLHLDAPIGVVGSSTLPVHTHDSSGIIHVESTVAWQFRLRDFFTIWGQPCTRTDMLAGSASAVPLALNLKA
jgi:hypothetical protein